MVKTTVTKIDENGIPSLVTTVPATLYLNGRQNPPIETDGEIICLSLNGLQFRCNHKVPIPSNGTIRFSLGSMQGQLELNVDFIQRIEIPKKFWVWRKRAKYEMRVALGMNLNRTLSLYQDELFRMIYGAKIPDSSVGNIE
ncbi:MAG: hypothetical protein C4527_09990 [Candidatus Omnitrophota bacterium]|jgi:hypothetical protein|nr:MAG: hypothetical protein C4527_09990 [Candidatus Omnitrophota bacterium]